MPVTKVQEEALLDQLGDVFRRYGYEGASLSRLSEATGLQRASLYHRFPGGKEEMARAVLNRTVGWVVEKILQPLGGPGTPRERLVAMAQRLDELYDGGCSSCLLDVFSLGGRGHAFENEVDGSLQRWIETLAAVAREAGVGPDEARRRAEDVLIRIQGSLVVSRGLRDTSPFQRTMEDLHRTLLPELDDA
ncbi:MAG: TetR/AcrR family transcriptional regulator [Acidobacteriota bacterium]|nr:TetR/AcrR family transcriptional regulator [Acidobacteriota bacterium]